MKKIVSTVLLIAFSASLHAGGLRFGMAGAVKSKVRELDKKVAAKKNTSGKDTGTNSFEDALSFSTFTASPVDFTVWFDTAAAGWSGQPIEPYFVYMHRGHWESPKHWYIITTTWTVENVYLAAKSVVYPSEIVFMSGQTGQSSTAGEMYNGENCLNNIQIRFHPAHGVTIKYDHLMMKKELYDRIISASGGYVILDSGVQLGYNHNEAGKKTTNIDITVIDKNKFSDADSGMDNFGDYYCFVNPLDYFDTASRNYILQQYQPYYQSMINDGTVMFSDLAVSSTTINIPGEIWGIWYKDDFNGCALGKEVNWSTINIVRKDQFNSRTFWKILNATPTIDGGFSDSTRNTDSTSPQGTVLYDTAPFQNSVLYILSGGNDQAGIMKIEQYLYSPVPDPTLVKYLKYEFHENNASTYFDDKLIMEGFDTENDARNAAAFSANAVTFRRTILPYRTRN